jgi:hypothetical protein
VLDLVNPAVAGGGFGAGLGREGSMNPFERTCGRNTMPHFIEGRDERVES